jgi:hypothetical protein
MAHPRLMQLFEGPPDPVGNRGGEPRTVSFHGVRIDA